MKYYSRILKNPTRANPVGEKEINEYEERISDTGEHILEISGKTNLYDFIQESKSMCDINNIIRRYKEGDLSALSRTTGTFGDFTGLPTSLAEAQQQIINIGNEFKKLPIEIREKFNHNPDEFIRSLENGKFQEFVQTMSKGELASDLTDRAIETKGEKE